MSSSTDPPNWPIFHPNKSQAQVRCPPTKSECLNLRLDTEIQNTPSHIGFNPRDKFLYVMLSKLLPHLIRIVIARGCLQLRNRAFQFHSSRINCRRPQTVKSFEMQCSKVAKVGINSSNCCQNQDQ